MQLRLFFVHGKFYYVSPEYEKYFSKEDFNSYKNFWDIRGEAVLDERLSTVIKFNRKNGGVVKNFYIKKYHYTFPRILRTFLYKSRASREFKNLFILKEMDIPAVTPVAYGVERLIGFVKTCFIITEELLGYETLKSFLKNKYKLTTNYDPFIKEFAEILKKLHANKFYIHTAFVKNILFSPDFQRNKHFYFIDVPFSGRRLLKNMARYRDIACLYKGVKNIILLKQQMNFICHYLDIKNKKKEKKELLRFIKNLRNYLYRIEHKTLVGTVSRKLKTFYKYIFQRGASTKIKKNL